MHNLIVGVSTSGKSNLAKAIAHQTPQDRGVIVYDPTQSSGWPERAIKLRTPEAFLDTMETATNARVFIDEAKTLWDFDTKRADRILYQGRHSGLLVFIICQRTAMVPPNARNQCSRVFSFGQRGRDVDKLAEEYHGAFRVTDELPQGHFICGNAFEQKTGHLKYYDKNKAEIVFNNQ